jgi:hypothetical protein
VIDSSAPFPLLERLLASSYAAGDFTGPALNRGRPHLVFLSRNNHKTHKIWITSTTRRHRVVRIGYPCPFFAFSSAAVVHNRFSVSFICANPLPPLFSRSPSTHSTALIHWRTLFIHCRKDSRRDISYLHIGRTRQINKPC